MARAFINLFYMFLISIIAMCLYKSINLKMRFIFFLNIAGTAQDNMNAQTGEIIFMQLIFL